MTPQEREQFRELQQRVEQLEGLIGSRANRVVLKHPVIVDGTVSADKVYTQRSGSYAELTT